MIVERAAALLAEHGIETPRADAEWIVAHVLGVKRSSLVTLCHEVDDAAVWPLVQRRTLREPLAYVLGEWDFRRLTLRCDVRALVPRPETEVVVERCLELLRGVTCPRVLDVGTGTGAIALALADELEGAEVVATDASADALELARENARLTGLRVELLQQDLRRGLPAGPFDLVVSNPPYVAPEDVAALPPEVGEHEPRTALIESGATEAIAEEALSRLVRGGSLAFEVADGKAHAVADLLSGLRYEEVTVRKDLAGRERVVDGRTPR